MNYQFSAAMRDMKPSAIREIFKSLGQPGAISLAAGNPAPESFPSEQMAAIAAEIFATQADAALQYIRHQFRLMLPFLHSFRIRF